MIMPPPNKAINWVCLPLVSIATILILISLGLAIASLFAPQGRELHHNSKPTTSVALALWEVDKQLGDVQLGFHPFDEPDTTALEGSCRIRIMGENGELVGSLFAVWLTDDSGAIVFSHDILYFDRG